MRISTIIAITASVMLSVRLIYAQTPIHSESELRLSETLAVTNPIDRLSSSPNVKGSTGNEQEENQHIRSNVTQRVHRFAAALEGLGGHSASSTLAFASLSAMLNSDIPHWQKLQAVLNFRYTCKDFVTVTQSFALLQQVATSPRDKRLASAHCSYAMSHYGRAQEAAAQLTTLVDEIVKEPHPDEIVLGVCYQRLFVIYNNKMQFPQQLHAAEEAWRLKQSSTFSDGHRQAAREDFICALLNNGKFDEAQQHLATALRENPDNSSLRLLDQIEHDNRKRKDEWNSCRDRVGMVID